jgi:DNA-directed RNA polymerase subunit RPC12/RpoP
MTSVACAGCHRRYEVDDRFIGKTIKCAYCGRPILISVAEPGGVAPNSGFDEYQLGNPVETGPSAFQASPKRHNGQRTERRRVSKGTRKRSRSRKIERRDAGEQLPLPVILIGLTAIGVVLVLLTVFVPGARKPVGVAFALPGLLLFCYGYASGVYIAFTEDDLYGWLFLIFPPYAAYYVVSRWDDMRSRLIMVVAGLGLLTIGGRMLKVARVAEDSSKASSALVRPRAVFVIACSQPLKPLRGLAAVLRGDTSGGHCDR